MKSFIAEIAQRRSSVLSRLARSIPLAGGTNSDLGLIQSSGFFDTKFYASKYGIHGGTAAAKHYVNVGWKLGFDPSAWFSTLSYLKLNPDVAAAGVNPLGHYLRHGRTEGRRVFEDGAPAPIAEQTDAEHADIGNAALPPAFSSAPAAQEGLLPELRRHFSAPYYLSFYRDVAKIGLDPLEHYLSHGWREDRNPSPTFDTPYYLRKHPELRQQNTDPLTHFLVSGGAAAFDSAPDHRIVLDPAKSAKDLPHWSDARVRIGVHAHVFYPELIGELYIALAQLPPHAMVRFTAVTEGDRRYVENWIKAKSPRWRFEIVLVPRIGQDLAPFFCGCVDLWRSTDLMLHIHTKRSLHTDFGDAWRRYLLDQCLGSPALLDRIFDVFANEPRVALVYPENYREIKKFAGLNGNESRLHALCEALGNGGFDVNSLDDFPAGSMAWFRSSAYADLVDYLNSFDAFGRDEEVEGTMAHVVERALSVVPLAAGLEVRSFSTPRRVALDYSPEARSYPVYFEPHAERWERDTPRIANNETNALAPRAMAYNRDSLNIHWVIPSFGPGAGGHMTIFRFVEFFERFGHRQTIWIQLALNYRAPADALKVIREHYRPLGERVFVRFLPNDVRQLSGDVLIATDAWSAYPVAAAGNFKERFYFIQDNEFIVSSGWG